MTKESLPAKCGPSCPLFSLRNRKCIYTGEIRQTNSPCSERFSFREVNDMVSNPKIGEIKKPS
jgi:hypothetical protein